MSKVESLRPMWGQIMVILVSKMPFSMRELSDVEDHMHDLYERFCPEVGEIVSVVSTPCGLAPQAEVTVLLYGDRAPELGTEMVRVFPDLMAVDAV